MNRLLVFALVASLGNESAAFAGESLLTSGARHVQQLAVAVSTSTSASSSALASAPPAGATVVVAGQKVAPSFQDQGGTLSKSGMGKGRKTLIYVGLAVAFAASVWTIDHHVLDVTPSSLGTRQD
ncbi:MAG TPA: hypothetical protein VM032_13770 [Vicinamibacterales bacterium]|nr:hypothetical protein [Vicinamibacterales bacterium]